MKDLTHANFLRWIESLRDGLSEYITTHPLLPEGEGRGEGERNTRQPVEIIFQDHEL